MIHFVYRQQEKKWFTKVCTSLVAFIIHGHKSFRQNTSCIICHMQRKKKMLTYHYLQFSKQQVRVMKWCSLNYSIDWVCDGSLAQGPSTFTYTPRGVTSISQGTSTRWKPEANLIYSRRFAWRCDSTNMPRRILLLYEVNGNTSIIYYVMFLHIQIITWFPSKALNSPFYLVKSSTSINNYGHDLNHNPSWFLLVLL